MLTAPNPHRFDTGLDHAQVWKVIQTKSIHRDAPL